MSFKQWIRDIKGFLQYGDLPTSYYVKKGLKVGRNFNRQSGTRLDPMNCWLISIGDDVIMGNRVQLLAHDFSPMHYTGFARFGRIVIGDRVFIGANSTILMNVHIGNDVIIGAGSLINKNIPDGYVVAGVPAKVICSTEDYIARQKAMMDRSPQIEKNDTSYGSKMTIEKQEKLLKMVNDSEGGVLYAKFRDYHYTVGTNEIEDV